MATSSRQSDSERLKNNSRRSSSIRGLHTLPTTALCCSVQCCVIGGACTATPSRHGDSFIFSFPRLAVLFLFVLSAVSQCPPIEGKHMNQNHKTWRVQSANTGG